MAPSTTVPVTYKKVDGVLTITRDRQLVLFTPSTSSGGPPTLKISTSEITNLGKSPAQNERVSMKVTAQAPSDAAPANFVFAFTSGDARADQTIIVDCLREILASIQASVNGPTISSPSRTPIPIPTLSQASPIKQVKDILSDTVLLSEVTLHKLVLDQHPELKQRFNESLKKLKTLPDVMSPVQFSQQFWSSRIHLLRAQAVEISQSSGTYNVLSQVKTTRDNEGVMKLNLSKEQIRLIFNQHPLARKVYDDLVPDRLTESDFWSKFFVSKLLKKLKGERITDLDGNIPDLDKYLNHDEDVRGQNQDFEPARMPRFLDLEGNTQDHTASQGNAAHLMMRPNTKERVPLLRVLNAMSEKMMANVAPVDSVSMHAPAGMDEKAYQELQLRDLLAEQRDNRIVLNIASEQKLFAQGSTPNSQEQAIDFEAIIHNLRKQLHDPFKSVLEFDDSAKSQAAATSTTVMESIKQRKALLSAPTEADTGLSRSMIESATMTHNTTVEFLHYFWAAYLSGDDARAAELAKLVTTLDKSLQRIDSVAQEAENERVQKRKALKQKNEEFRKRTGRESRISLDSVGGGGKALHKLVRATEDAVKAAEREYQKVFAEQSASTTANG